MSSCRSNEGAHPVWFVIVKLRNKDTDEAAQQQWRLAPGRLISVSGSRDKDINVFSHAENSNKSSFFTQINSQEIAETEQ